MVKKLNRDLIAEHIESLKEEGKVSQGTITTYTNVGKNIPFNITTSQATLIKKLRQLSDNPNTLSANLNLVLLVRRANDLEVDKLINLRNSLSKDITATRKKNLSDMNDKLPSYEYIKNELDGLSGRRYIINYLFVSHGLRNKDINLQYVKKVPQDGESNYITSNKKNTKLHIRDYKTEEKYGDKEIVIKDEKFIQELKRLGLGDGDYLISKANGDRINSVSTFNEKVLNLSIDKLGQNRLFKVVIKHLLNTKGFDELERLSRDRGTSLDTILKSYNLHAGSKNDED
jgi:hypothetical protein